VLLLTGAREVGKTMLLRSLAARNRGYVTWTTRSHCAWRATIRRCSCRATPPPMLIDEVQFAPQLLPHIKMAVDAGAAPGSFAWCRAWCRWRPTRELRRCRHCGCDFQVLAY